MTYKELMASVPKEVFDKRIKKWQFHISCSKMSVSEEFMQYLSFNLAVLENYLSEDILMEIFDFFTDPLYEF